MALMEIAATIGGAAVLDVVAARIFSRVYRNERRPDAIHFTTTADGWKLALHQYETPPGIKKKTPIICCHGLTGNHHCFDLAEHTSLAKFLARAGHPTFLLDLRGAGQSEKGGPCREKSLHWKLSDHYQYDAPAAVDKVRELTGAQKVHWIGHSMGGMIAYAFLQTELAARISRVVILASPATFTYMQPVHRFRWILKILPGVPLRTLTQSVAPLFESWRFLQTISGAIYLPPGHHALFAANCQDQSPGRLLWDFANFVKHGHYLTDDGGNMLEGMKNISTPTLFMVGDADQTASDGAVEAAYQAFGSKEKEYLLLGKKQGHASDYGHLTILLGGHVYDEVFPHIVRWLAKG